MFERFYGGGIRSFRGFSFRGMGPFENRYLAVGGTFAWLNTVEYQIPILANDKFHWATFVDHGTVEQSRGDQELPRDGRDGIRLAIPALGPLPLALDFAFPLNKGPGDKRPVVNFSWASSAASDTRTGNDRASLRPAVNEPVIANVRPRSVGGVRDGSTVRPSST